MEPQGLPHTEACLRLQRVALAARHVFNHGRVIWRDDPACFSLARGVQGPAQARHRAAVDGRAGIMPPGNCVVMRSISISDR